MKTDILFALNKGPANELWGTRATGEWAQRELGACVVIVRPAHLKYHAPGEAPVPAPVALSASMVEAMDETMGVGQ